MLAKFFVRSVAPPLPEVGGPGHLPPAATGPSGDAFGVPQFQRLAVLLHLAGDNHISALVLDPRSDEFGRIALGEDEALLFQEACRSEMDLHSLLLGLDLQVRASPPAVFVLLYVLDCSFQCNLGRRIIRGHPARAASLPEQKRREQCGYG